MRENPSPERAFESAVPFYATAGKADNFARGGCATIRIPMLGHLTRIWGFRRLWRALGVGSVPLRTEFDIWNRPHYAFGVYTAASLARMLGRESVSVIEFGVAGGNGLLALEDLARRVEAHLGVRIAVYGFDGGVGMPRPRDYRDLPHIWGEGFYRMDADRLRARLRSAKLVLGDVSQTVPAWLESLADPVGFIAFDLDYYSSTKAAFAVFDGEPETRLPRVFCYFDDIIHSERACANEYVGELCAIREYNQEHELRKIAKFPHLNWIRRHAARWNEQIYVHHDFTHPAYTQLITPEGAAFRQIALQE